MSAPTTHRTSYAVVPIPFGDERDSYQEAVCRVAYEWIAPDRSVGCHTPRVEIESLDFDIEIEDAFSVTGFRGEVQLAYIAGEEALAELERELIERGPSAQIEECDA